MNLTSEERIKFAKWLEREAATGKEIMTQLTSLGEYTKVLVKKEQLELAAALVIARKLRSIESQQVG